MGRSSIEETALVTLDAEEAEQMLPAKTRTVRQKGNPMKALTFLGTGKYQTITYVWRDESGEDPCETRLFPVALDHLFKPDEVVVFLTSEARNSQYLQELKDLLSNRLREADIPSGKSEEELWEIFDRVTSSVSEGDIIVLDITHALRSIPMVVFAAAAYLRRTKKVTVKHILYGAFEVREPASNPAQPGDRAPVFDLKLLLDLLDWSGEADFFLRRSDAVLLGERLRSTQDTLRRRHVQQQPKTDLPAKLKTVGEKLKELSLAVHLARPLDAMRCAHRLLPDLEAAAAEAERWAKPFAVILEQVRAEAEQFAHPQPEQLDEENLRKQYRLIEHLVQKGLVFQAVALAREWMVSLLTIHHNNGSWLDEKYREHTLEKALGAAQQRLQGKEAEVPEWFSRLPNGQKMAETWDWLANLRNDVAHCGMRKGAGSITSIEARTKEIPERLRALLDN